MASSQPRAASSQRFTPRQAGALLVLEPVAKRERFVVGLQRLVRGGGGERMAAGCEEVAAGAGRLGQRTRIVEVPRDVRGVTRGIAVLCCHGVGQREVQALSARRGQRFEQGLPHQPMRELVAVGARPGGREGQPGGLGGLDRAQHGITVLAAGALDQAELEAQAHHRRLPQHRLRGFAQSLEALADDQPYAVRHRQRVGVQVGAPAAVRVEQQAFLVEMAKYGLHEEGIALGLAVDHVDDRRRRVGTAEAGQQGGHLVASQVAQQDAADAVEARKSGQRPLERLAHVGSHVAVGHDVDDPQSRQVRGKVLEEQHR